jgi:hypothetical protein
MYYIQNIVGNGTAEAWRRFRIFLPIHLPRQTRLRFAHLGECKRRFADLTPENVSWDSNEFCNYCDNVMSKDD